MEIKIKYSHNRRRTVGARFISGAMHIYAPSGIPEHKLNPIIDAFKKKFEKKQMKKELNSNPERLLEITNDLNRKYFDGKLEVKSIAYSGEQDKMYGVCYHKRKEIWISYRLKEMPDWVRNYVIVHELAHLLQPNHSADFWNLVNRYKLAERARGYLIAKHMESIEEEQNDITE